MKSHKQLRLGTLIAAAAMLMSGCAANKEHAGDEMFSADNSADTYSDTSSKDLPLDSSIENVSKISTHDDTSSKLLPNNSHNGDSNNTHSGSDVIGNSCSDLSSAEPQETSIVGDISSSMISELYTDYYVAHNGIYYVNISDNESWQGVEFTRGNYFGQVLYNTESRELSSIQPGSSNVLPIGTELYESNEDKTVILAKINDGFIPYVKAVEG